MSTRKEKTMSRLSIISIGLFALLSTGCDLGTETGGVSDGDENIIVPPGKEDNFFSNVAQEFKASTTVELKLADTYAQKTAEEQMDRAGGQEQSE